MSRLHPQNSLDFQAFTVHEQHVDLNREALLHIAKDAQVLVLRVQTFGPSGRPSSRTLRIPRQLLEEPTPEPRTSWEA